MTGFKDLQHKFYKEYNFISIQIGLDYRRGRLCDCCKWTLVSLLHALVQLGLRFTVYSKNFSSVINCEALQANGAQLTQMDGLQRSDEIVNKSADSFDDTHISRSRAVVETLPLKGQVWLQAATVVLHHLWSAHMVKVHLWFVMKKLSVVADSKGK